MYLPFEKSVKDYFSQTSSDSSGSYENGHIGYGLSSGTGMVSISRQTVLTEYFKNADDLDVRMRRDQSYIVEFVHRKKFNRYFNNALKA